MNFLTISLTNQLCPSYSIGWERWSPLKSDILHICTADMQYTRIKHKLLCKIGDVLNFYFCSILPRLKLITPYIQKSDKDKLPKSIFHDKLSLMSMLMFMDNRNI